MSAKVNPAYAPYPWHVITTSKGVFIRVIMPPSKKGGRPTSQEVGPILGEGVNYRSKFSFGNKKEPCVVVTILNDLDEQEAFVFRGSEQARNQPERLRTESAQTGKQSASGSQWGFSEEKFCLAGFCSDVADLSEMWGLGVLSSAPKRATSDSNARGPNPAQECRKVA